MPRFFLGRNRCCKDCWEECLKTCTPLFMFGVAFGTDI
jgi:hypothetical protein